jgi:hypothetical protein
MKILTAVIALILLSVSAMAQNKSADDGNALLRGCNVELRPHGPFTLVETSQSGYCRGLIKGIYDVFLLYEPGIVCAPDQVTLRQNVRIVVKYLNDHPEELHIQDSLLVIRALSKAYPCKRETKGGAK